MRLSHVAVLVMMALSVVVDSMIPFPLPDRGGTERLDALPLEGVSFSGAPAAGTALSETSVSTQDNRAQVDDRRASPYGEPRGEVMNHTDGTGFYLRPQLAPVDSRWAGVSLPGDEDGAAAGSPPPAKTNMEVSDVLGRDTAGTGADRNNLHPGDGAAGDSSVGMRGIATYYHPSLHGAIMADGRTFNEWDPTIVASNDFPLGAVLEITFTRSITAVVSDRGLLDRGQVDLSRAGFVALLGSTQPGRVAVKVREVQ